ncbi:hypothetical protein [Streptococcus pyogenes]|uniref:hypothetical protein n=1 Tax=Streptococcus pyogenes TaxID=1314 RepID=UPI0010A0D5C6|nr:hypothetical protein [Streptococcus pyogenes]VHA58151.1 Uncharacterised protein [Streptococcus pyogenes]VHC83535.1 Uncharacterised protein [Streptococcus pyogenes]VHC87727.1 Uncharacterised protein [Streptococcus pyogenes]VHD11519.1 Uncharacterised protein [Streptococcus pyogenes]HER5564599.1 hypothetical protein [Streptococcus pyogenes]
MKTRSKRFLNLATLCLALLGTALLMTCPVKADVSTPEMAQTLAGSDTNGDDEYTKNWNKGYGEGYKEGSDPYAEEKDETELDKLAKDKAKNEGDGYSDGYQTGYSEGWQKHHPIQAFLSFIWYVISDFFSLR